MRTSGFLQDFAASVADYDGGRGPVPGAGLGDIAHVRPRPEAPQRHPGHRECTSPPWRGGICPQPS